jgi:protein TonB
MPHARWSFRDFGGSARIISPRWSVASALLASLAACGGGERSVVRDATALPPARLANTTELQDGSVPRMLNIEPPFRYPAELYARKVQGNVMLRLHVDSVGRVSPESTSIVSSSGYPELDSAAVHGAAALRFAPAMRDGRPIGRSIRFPVLFRHPEAAPLPGDSILKR